MEEKKGQAILVIEDEPQLLMLLKDAIEAHGYRVLAAQDGPEAVNLYRQHRDKIDLVFCDMALPKLGGWTVFLSLKEVRPDVKMVLASAYLDPRVRSDMISQGAMDFIPKPYVIDDVLATFRRVLSS